MTTFWTMFALCVAFVALVIGALMKSGSDADDAIDAWRAMPDLRAEREARVSKAKELVLENRG